MGKSWDEKVQQWKNSLKPCPLCFGQVELSCANELWDINCLNTRCPISTIPYRYVEDLIKEWNTRDIWLFRA